jgi:methylated-DNA-[protein]-cysteine S-methyltransferase
LLKEIAFFLLQSTVYLHTVMPKVIVFPFRTYYESPAGVLEILASQNHVHAINFLKKDEQPKSVVESEMTRECSKQLHEYFAGTLKQFTFPVDQYGTEFQQQVWKALCNIPFGKTISYLTLALQMGDEKLTRAVANANGKNQLAIVIPCHRVIGSNGSLTGYAGGMERKRWLLDHEAKVCDTYMKLF